MRSFNSILICCVLAGVTQAQEVDSQDLEKIVNASKVNTDKFDKSEIITEVVDKAKGNKYKISKNYTTNLLKPKNIDSKALYQSTKKTDETLWNALANASQQQATLTQKQERYGGVKTFILVSLSMPIPSLETLFTEVGYLENKEDIVFVFQGWQAPNFNAFIAKVDRLMPLGHEPNVVVDPTIFKKLDVSEVPFFAIKTENKGWKKVLGDVSLNLAIIEANSHYEIFKPIGPIYPIAEPNMLDYIYKKIEETDWEQQITAATNKLIDKQASNVDLPLSDISYRYLVNGTVTINEDIKVDGESVVEPGQQVNPLEHMSLSKSYAIVDVSSKTQLDIVRYWKRSHINVKVITTELPAYIDKHELEGEFGEIHQLDPLLAKRFGLERIPSIVYQKGMELVVEVVKHDLKIKELVGE